MTLMGSERWQAATCGMAATVAGLAASELPSGMSPRFPSLVSAAGQWVIRNTPGRVVHLAIGAVGTADKPLLVGAIVAVLLVVGAATAPFAIGRAGAVDLLTVAVAGLGWLGAAPFGRAPWGQALVPAVLGALTAIVARRASLRALMPELPDRPTLAIGATSSRRRFLAAGSIAAGSAAVALGGAAAARRSRPDQSPSALPGAAEANRTPTQGLVIAGLSPLITPTGSFYRIDEALMIPSVDVGGWRLRVSGMVGSPFELSYADLLAEPLVERDITLCCVSNEVGGRLVGTARWTGVRLADLLARAGVDPAATQVVGRSVDGFTAGFPVATALDGRDALIAVGMNGETLPPKHGYPARLVVPGLYGFVSATKWLSAIELTTWDAFDPYWVERGWAREAPVKVSSRIDVPKDYSRVAPGRQAIAGVAWAPTSGIAAVMVRIDGGAWQEARLGPSLGDDAWRQWTTEWDPTPGTHEIEARAVTRDGREQIEEKRSAFPNGASGLHRSHVRVVPNG